MGKDRVIVKGGGDIASGTIQKLHKSGFNVLVLEIEKPTSIRRRVCFSEAVYNGEAIIEDSKSVLVETLEEIYDAWESGIIPIVIDSEGTLIDKIKPLVVVDAILAKRNTGTNINMAPITIGLGPGFNAGKDVHIAVETMRGHNLGRLIFHGYALKNTGVPGKIGGYDKERVIYSPCEGIISTFKNIGDIVTTKDILAIVNGQKIYASIDGVLRGIIRSESYVKESLKIADIDPRYDELDNCNTISDKARCIAGGVLEGILYMKSSKI